MRLGTKLFLIFVVLFNLLYNASLPLHPDEAYYWVWSKNLELSYYDHPPMVAYAIRLVTLLGDSEWVVRLAAVGAMSAAALLVYRLGTMLFNRRVGDTALWIYLLIPMTHLGFLVITPDPVLSFFWALTLVLFYQGVFRKKNMFLLLAGVSVGLLLLSKYTGILLPVSLALFLAFTTQFRSLYKRKILYMAIVLGFLVFLPVLLWNASHDWASFRYQFYHGVAEEKVLNPATFLEFFIGQFAVSNPLFFFGLLFFLMRRPWRHVTEPRLAFLTWPFALTLLFLGYNSLFKKSELNWAMPAMISGSVLLAYWLEKEGKQRLIRWAAAFCLAVILVFKGPELLPFLPAEIVMKSQFMGYDRLFGSTKLQPQGELVISDNYKTASELAYYLPGRPAVYILDDAPVSQFTFWQNRLRGSAGREAVWIGEGEPSPRVRTLFERVERTQTITFRNRFTNKEYHVFRCYGFRELMQDEN